MQNLIMEQAFDGNQPNSLIWNANFDVGLYFPAQMAKLKASITSMGEKNYSRRSLRVLLTMS